MKTENAEKVSKLQIRINLNMMENHILGMFSVKHESFFLISFLLLLIIKLCWIGVILDLMRMKRLRIRSKINYS